MMTVTSVVHDDNETLSIKYILYLISSAASKYTYSVCPVDPVCVLLHALVLSTDHPSRRQSPL